MLGSRASAGLQAAQPHLEDGSVYRQNRPTRLDEIKNFHIEVQSGAVTGIPGGGVALSKSSANGPAPAFIYDGE